MKRRINPDKTDHHACLSRQALNLLRDLYRHTGGSTFLFPNLRDPKRPMSNNTLLKAVERMGYKGDMTGHWFRTLAMWTLKEVLHCRDAVMQCWAGYIDRIAADALQAS